MSPPAAAAAAATQAPQPAAANRRPRPPHAAPVCLDVHGNGQVGGTLLRLAEQAGLPVRTLHDSRGIRLERRRDGRPVLVDCTPPRYNGPEAEAWICFLEDRLRASTPLVTCNKAPLALAWKRLHAAARHGGVPILDAATVGGGTPVVPVLERLAATQGVEEVEASLSGTLGFVLDRISSGQRLEAAVAEAQRLGYAEPDPALDLDGTDARAKGVLLHNRLFPHLAPLSLADAGPPLQLDPARISALASQGAWVRAVVRVRPGHVSLHVEDAPWLRHALPGAATARARTRQGGHYTIEGPGAGAEATAANLLGDLLHLEALTWSR